MSRKDELLLTLSEARNAVVYCEGVLKAKQTEQARELLPLKGSLSVAQNALSEIEAEILRAMDDHEITSMHSDTLHFTAYVKDDSGLRVIDEEEVVAALTERQIAVPWQKPPKPKLNQTKAKKIATEQFGGDFPGMAFVESRSVQVKATER